MSGFKFNPLIGTLDRVSGSSTVGPPPGEATQAPKIVASFQTDALSLIGDLCVVNGTKTVTKINSNLSTEIPKGIFGIITTKQSDTECEVLFVGIQGGYSGFTTGQALFIDTSGTLTHTVPLAGTVQQVGFAVSETEIFVYPQQAIRRST